MNWGVLGKIGGALSGFIPGVGPLIKAGLGVGGSLLGSKLGKSQPTDLENQATAANIAGMKQGQLISQQSQDQASKLFPQAQSLFDMSRPAMQAPINYWSSILSGNHGAVTSAMGPELTRIGEGYQAAGNAQSALTPRGGSSANINADRPFQQQRDVTTALQSARPAAATSLFSAGTAVGNQGNQMNAAGSNLLQNAIQGIYGTTEAGKSILASEAARRQQDIASGTGIGSTIFKLIQGLDLSKLGKSGGSSGRSANDKTMSQSPGY